MGKHILILPVYKKLCQQIYGYRHRRVNIKIEWVEDCIDYQKHVRWLR